MIKANGSEARRVNRKVKAATANPWLTHAVRLGYVTRGILYGGMGVLALSLAFGAPTNTTDQKGVLLLLSGNPLAAVVLTVVIISVSAYSMWGFVRAIYDPLNRGHTPPGIAARVGFAWSGLNYAVLAVVATGFLVGTAGHASSDSVQELVRSVLNHPGGPIVVVVAGVIGIISGLSQFVDAVRAPFKKDMKRNQMTKPERMAADSLGRMGMVARGIVFTMLSVFILMAGLYDDPGRAHGMGVAFQAIARAPVGHVSLALVAIGFVALGLHSCLNAAWVRMPTNGNVRKL